MQALLTHSVYTNFSEKDEVTNEESVVCQNYLSKNFKNAKFSPEGPGLKALGKTR